MKQMSELIDQLLGQSVCLFFNGRTETGILCAVGDGLLCLDVAGETPPVRIFYPLTAITAFRLAATNEA